MQRDLWALGEYLGLSLFSVSDIHNSVIVKKDFWIRTGKRFYDSHGDCSEKRCGGGRGEGSV